MNDIFVNFTHIQQKQARDFQSLNRMCDRSHDGSFLIVFRTGVSLLLAVVTCLRVVFLRCQGNGDHHSTSLCLFSICSLSLFVLSV